MAIKVVNKKTGKTVAEIKRRAPVNKRRVAKK